MTTPPPDQAARDLIRTATDRTLFVNAGAGSGKTRALVDRVMTLVLVDGVPLAEIAAVTFTEKAGAELRDRLRARLEQESTASDVEDAGRARAALEDLDEAAIGTLHSFAQRILGQHPIEAELPPVVEVLDEVGSGVAFAERWAVLQHELLDDDTVAEALLLGLGLGVRLDHVRTLARLLGNDWDLIEDRVLTGADPSLVLPDWRPLLDEVNRVVALRDGCRNPDCPLLAKLVGLEELAVEAAAAPDEQIRFGVIQRISEVKVGRDGRQGDWDDIKAVRAAVQVVAGRADAMVDALVDSCLQRLTRWTARRVLDAAQQRRAEGRLEFHDLLVLSRDLLRHDATVRGTLQRRYSRLLLDEFQDTDPIQVELAVRIAAGADGGAADWRDVAVPGGRLFFVGDAKQSIYRFRRADIRTYLEAEDTLGEHQTLSANFRSVPGVLGWVNDVFSRLIEAGDHQPHYHPLDAVRAHGGSGPAVTVLGAEAHVGKVSADELRAHEAADVAGIVGKILDEQWQVWDERQQAWRPARHRDVAVLLPSRTALPALTEALERAGVPFRAEASSLVYESEEIRELLMCARVLSDPSDDLAMLSVLRSPLFGCGDDDLFRWRQASGRRGWWRRDEHGELVTDGPVGRALELLRRMAWQSDWQTPSEVLERIVDECRVLEVAAGRSDVRDVWRRVRFVVDQARAWQEISGGGLREYVAWAAYQAQEATRVAEAVLPETDTDAVRAMTVHAAKGLEFPIVVMAGMSTQPMQSRGVRLLWNDHGYAVSLGKGIETADYAETQPIDEQMDGMEKRRLLYVAATRARDHLVVSLHRTEQNKGRAADLLATAGAVTPDVIQFTAPQPPEPFDELRTTTVEGPGTAAPTPPPPWDEWQQGVLAARTNAATERVRSASGLEGTEPELVLDERLGEQERGLAKGARDLELAPWSKGRYGSAVGRAVHAVLQSVDLATGAGLEAAVAAQSLAEGVTAQSDLVRSLARSALDSDLVQRAQQREHWRESYVGTARTEDGVLLEGYVDLIFRGDDGALVVVDYKTDALPQAALESRVSYYAPQMAAYRQCLAAATGAPVRSVLLFLHPTAAVPVPVG